jgi:probable F420-dependent oxidoreductase
MQFGITMFATDYAIQPAELAMECEARGYESIWFPEHSHIPTSRKSPWPGGPDLPKWYYDTYDQFLALTAAAAVTKKIKLGTGICLVVQRDAIYTAKEVATLDRISNGRFLFGIGGGWNAEEMADHDKTDFKDRFKLMRERIEAMKEIWGKSKPKYAGDLVKFDEMMQWPKPVQKPHPPIIVGGGFPHGARRAINYGNGWMPIGGRGGDTLGMIPPFLEMLKEKGRKLEDVPITLFGVGMNVDAIKKARDAGVDRVVFGVPPEAKDKVLPLLDKGVAAMKAAA